MENRRLLIAMAAGLAAILLWMQFVGWLDRKKGWDKLQQASQSTTQPAGTSTTNPSSQPAEVGTAGPATAPTSLPAQGMASGPGSAQVVPATQPTAAGPQPVAIGLANPKNGDYALQLTVDPRGAGFGKVILNQFTMTAARNSPPYAYQEPPVQDPDFIPLASRSITIDKATYDIGGLNWNLLSESPTQAVYGADLVDKGHALVEIRKSFTVSPRKEENQGYEVRLDYSFRNLGDKPLVMRTEFNGPVLPPEETQSDREVVGGYLEGQSVVYESHHITDFKPDKDNGQITITTDSKNHRARWAGGVNNYFGVVLLPLNMEVNGVDKGNADYIDSIVAQGINLKADLAEERNAFLTFQTKDITLAPGQTTTLPLDVYAGPKWRQVLDTKYYMAFPRMYNVLLVIRSVCGMSFCTVGWLADAMVGFLRFLHAIFFDWGLAIMGLVAIVRLILHPITRQSQISMAKMQKMGPEMKRLQEKYKDDKEALNRAMMDFHKQQGLGPYLGCLPMFLQMPIWVALYGVLLTTFELRHAPFLWGFTWIKDLSQPDYIVKFAHPVPLIFGWHLYGIAILPLLLAVVMVLQQQFMPKPVAASPEQMQQQKMMQWVSPIMFLLIFYSYPSGLNLYIFASTGVGVLESKIVRDHIRAREEAEKAGRVFVETRPTRASRQGKAFGPQQPARNGGPVGWLTSRWAKLLEHAEQVKKDNEKRGKK